MKDIYKNSNRNIEVLRDLIVLMPHGDLVNAYHRWEWRVDDMGRLHIVQAYNSDSPSESNNDRVVLDIAFEGDGIVIVSLCDKTNGDVIIREAYDDHCLDKGARLHRYLKEMNPRDSDFSDRYRKIVETYFSRRKNFYV